MTYRDLYKTRAEAWRDFIEPQKIGISRAKFFDDAGAFVQQDKSLRLADLLAYVRAELKVDLATGQSLKQSPGDVERERRLAELEERKLLAEVEAKERSNRRDHGRWIETVEHETQMAAFAGRLEEGLRQGTSLRLAALVHVCGGDPSRTAELAAELEALHAEALAAAVRLSVQVVAFEEMAA